MEANGSHTVGWWFERLWKVGISSVSFALHDLIPEIIHASDYPDLHECGIKSLHRKWLCALWVALFSIAQKKI